MCAAYKQIINIKSIDIKESVFMYFLNAVLYELLFRQTCQPR